MQVVISINGPLSSGPKKKRSSQKLRAQKIITHYCHNFIKGSGSTREGTDTASGNMNLSAIHKTRPNGSGMARKRRSCTTINAPHAQIRPIWTLEKI